MTHASPTRERMTDLASDIPPIAHRLADAARNVTLERFREFWGREEERKPCPAAVLRIEPLPQTREPAL